MTTEQYLAMLRKLADREKQRRKEQSPTTNNVSRATIDESGGRYLLN